MATTLCLPFRLLVLAALAQLSPLPAAARPAKKPRDAGLADFAAVAQQRVRKCQGPDAAGPDGWQSVPAQCAWQDRLQMRRWTAPPAGAQSCVAQPARWLAWQRPRLGLRPQDPGLAWRTEWKSQVVQGSGSGDERRIAIVDSAGGSWSATEYTWTPPARASTRAWQQRRWDKLTAGAAALRSADPAPHAALLAAWERNLHGRPGEIGPTGWRWISEGQCLRMSTLAAADIPLPLPYAREDARLEQRAAMQIRLARRYPQASFVAPFRLLDQPAGSRRAGAKYAAVWTERSAVTGQLWIPLKDDQPVLRAQVVAALPARYDTPAGLAAGTRAVRAIESELAGISAAWSAANER